MSETDALREAERADLALRLDDHMQERYGFVLGSPDRDVLLDSALAVVAKHRDAEVERLRDLCGEESETADVAYEEYAAAQDRIARALAVIAAMGDRYGLPGLTSAERDIRAILTGTDQ